MRKSLLTLFTCCLFSSSLFGQTGDVEFSEKQESTDMEALRAWLRDKRMVSVKEIGGDLSLSGEVRTEFQYTNERKNDIQQRGGSNSPSNKPPQAWDIEVNLMLDYRTDRTWAAIKLEFDNDMGLRGGTVSKIKLEKAYLGGRIVPGDTFIMDAEIGRRYLINVFDSKIEFASLYDGVLLRFNKAFVEIGDFYYHIGALLVDDKTNHYAYVMELGALRIANVGLNLKYSLIDWHKHFTNPQKNLRYKFLVSQFVASYQCTPAWIGKRLIKLYSAALCNHLAGGVSVTAGERANWGWYSGVSIGMVRKQGDWAVDANYQWVQAQAIPDYDVSGIGHGNAAGVGLYTTNVDGEGGATTISTAVGNCNYKGFEIDALYAFTDNLTVQNNLKISHTLKIFRDSDGASPNITYKQFELEFIYAF